MKKLKSEDTLVIKSIDRLGLNYAEISSALENGEISGCTAAKQLGISHTILRNRYTMTNRYGLKAVLSWKIIQMLIKVGNIFRLLSRILTPIEEEKLWTLYTINCITFTSNCQSFCGKKPLPLFPTKWRLWIKGLFNLHIQERD